MLKDLVLNIFFLQIIIIIIIRDVYFDEFKIKFPPLDLHSVHLLTQQNVCCNKSKPIRLILHVNILNLLSQYW